MYLQAWRIVHLAHISSHFYPPSLFAALLLLRRASSFLYQAACKLFSFIFIKNNDYKRQKPAYAGRLVPFSKSALGECVPALLRNDGHEQIRTHARLVVQEEMKPI